MPVETGSCTTVYVALTLAATDCCGGIFSNVSQKRGALYWDATLSPMEKGLLIEKKDEILSIARAYAREKTGWVLDSGLEF